MANEGYVEVVNKIVPRGYEDDPQIGNKYKVVDAHLVEYHSAQLGADVKSAEDAINKLYEMLTAVPTLSYAEDFSSSQQYDKGSQLQLKIKSSSSQGELSFLIEKHQGSGWITVLRETQAPGDNVFNLGTVSTTEQVSYRISATDMRGTAAVVGTDGKYLTFDCTLGGIEFTHSLERILTRKTLKQDDWNEINLEVTAKYASSTTGTLTISCSDSVKLSSNASGPGSNKLELNVNSGNSIITFYVTCSSEEPAQEGTLSLKLSSGKYASAENSYTTVFLDKDKLFVIVDKVSKTKLSTRNSLVIQYHVSSTIDSITSNTFLQTTCKFTNESCTASCSHGLTWERIKNDTRINTPMEWNVGSFPHAGTWTGELSVTTPGGITFTSVVSEESFEVEEPSTSFITDNLVFSFDPSGISADNAKWNSDSNSRDDYYITLANVDGVRSGRITDVDADQDYIRFAPGTYGIVHNPDKTAYNPFNTTQFKDPAVSSIRYTLEMSYRAVCIGNMDAVALSCKTAKQNSLLASYTKLSGNYGLSDITTYAADNKWIHVCYVFDSDISNENPTQSLKIYINGVLSKYGECDFKHVTDSDYTPLCINGVSDVLKQVTQTGLCDIRLIRAYDTALTSANVLTNFLSTLPENERKEVEDRNASNTNNMPTIYMVRQRASRIIPSDKTHISFQRLHAITKKKPDNAQDKDDTSKGCYVPCDIIYTFPGADPVVYPYTHVFLQGTSSLQYPVKNYQFKFYDVLSTEDGKVLQKKKIIPPAKQGEWKTKSAVYTLKCDYMEQSHKNNTPTAKYYDHVRNHIITGNLDPESASQDNLRKYSPAARVVEVDDTRPGQKYRDTIDGFPVLLYCLDIEDALDIDTEGEAKFINEVLNSENQYLGTFMFNVDKEGDQLGFKLDKEEFDNDLLMLTPEEKSDLITDLGDYTVWHYGIPDDDSATVDSVDDDYLTRVKKPALLDGSPVVLDTPPCISYEGAANVAVAAATFFTLEEARDVALYYNPKQVKDAQTNATTWFINNQDTGIAVQHHPITHALNTPVKNSKTGKWEIDQYDAEGNTTKSVSEIKFTELHLPSSWSDYIKTTLEPRFTFAKDWEDIAKPWFKEVTYSPMRRAIEWVASFFKFDVETYEDTLITERIDEFKRDFPKYFNYEYCLAYYLQMLFFTQIDNAGKNAMFDTWYDGVLYPRPYDMDSQMGETNTGEDIVSPAAEVHRKLSPEKSSGVTCSGSSPRNTERFIEYNTSTNRLWAAFGDIYFQDIKSCYIALRDAKIYDVATIVEFVNNLTSKVIGEKFYNDDAVNKYLSVKKADGSFNPDHLPKLQGNRDIRYPSFLEQRMLFLDSYFQYNKTYTKMTLRSDTAQGADGSIDFRISTYSPQYIRLNVGSTETNAVIYVDEQSVTGEIGNETAGVYVECSVSGTNKEVTISGAGSIRTLGNLADAKVSEIKCAEAVKLTDCRVSGAPRLKTLALGGNTYLQELNASNCEKLEGTIDVSGCSNLAKLDISNSRVQTLSLPESGCLEELNCQNTQITTLEITNQKFLQQLSLPQTVTTLNFSNSNLPEELDLSSFLSLTTVVINNCSGLKTLKLNLLPNIQTLIVSGCEDLHSIDLTQMTFSGNEIDFSSLDNLTDVILTKMVCIHADKAFTLKLPKKEKIQKLYLDTSCVTAVNPQATDKTDGIYHLENCLSKPTGNADDLCMYFASNTAVKKILTGNDYEYEGKLYQCFYQCKNLTEVQCKYLISTQNTICRMHMGATKLYPDVKQWVEAAYGPGFSVSMNVGEAFANTPSLRKAIDVINLFPNLSGSYQVFLSARQVKPGKVIDSATGKETDGYVSDTENLLPMGLAMYSLAKHHPATFNMGYMWHSCGGCFCDEAQWESKKDTDPLVTDWLNTLSLTPQQKTYHKDNAWWMHGHVFDPWKYPHGSGSGKYDYPPAAEGQITRQPFDPQVNPPLTIGMHAAFSSNSGVRKVSGTILEGLKIGSAYIYSIFAACSNLTSVDGTFVLPMLDSKQSVADLFMSCRNLESVGPDDSCTPLIDTSKCAAHILDMSRIFGDCSKLKINVNRINGIFNNCTELKTANCMFAFDYQLGGSFDSNFKLNTTETDCPVEDLGGLFASCLQLSGTVPSTIFSNCPKITHIGSKCIKNFTNSNYLAIGGAFSNTKLTSFAPDFLAGLQYLTDCSYLFSQDMRQNNSTYAITSAYDGTTLYPPLCRTTPYNYNTKTIKVNTDAGYGLEEIPAAKVDEQSGDLIPIIPSSVTNVNFMFAGNTKMTSIASDFLIPSKVEQAAGIFCGCNNAELEADLNTTAQKLYQNKTKLQTAEYAFANSYVTVIDSGTLFSGCNLDNSSELSLKGMFMNSELTSVDTDDDENTNTLSVNMFAPVSNVLVSTEDMFANCTKLAAIIGRASVTHEPEATFAFKLQGSQAKLFKEGDTISPDSMTIRYGEGVDDKDVVYFTYGENTYCGVDVTSDSIELSESYTTATTVLKKLDVSVTEVWELWDCVEGAWAPRTDGRINVSCEAPGEVVISTNSQGTEISNVSGGNKRYNINYFNLIPDQRLGLFYGCKKLRTVAGMFEHCTALYGGIPEDMFNSNAPFERLTDVQRLFAYCHNLTKKESTVNNTDLAYTTASMYQRYNVVDPYLVPSNWLCYCTKITTVSGMFKYCGNTYYPKNEDHRGKTSRKGKIDCGLFNYSSSITDASEVFRGCLDIAQTTLTSQFLKKSLPVLTTVRAAFRYSIIHQFARLPEQAPFVPDSRINRVLSTGGECFWRLEFTSTGDAAGKMGYGPSAAYLQALDLSNGYPYSKGIEGKLSNDDKIVNWIVYNNGEEVKYDDTGSTGYTDKIPYYTLEQSA